MGCNADLAIIYNGQTKPAGFQDGYTCLEVEGSNVTKEASVGFYKSEDNGQKISLYSPLFKKTWYNGSVEGNSSNNSYLNLNPGDVGENTTMYFRSYINTDMIEWAFSVCDTVEIPEGSVAILDRDLTILPDQTLIINGGMSTNLANYSQNNGLVLVSDPVETESCYLSGDLLNSGEVIINGIFYTTMVKQNQQHPTSPFGVVSSNGSITLGDGSKLWIHYVGLRGTVEQGVGNYFNAASIKASDNSKIYVSEFGCSIDNNQFDVNEPLSLTYSLDNGYLQATSDTSLPFRLIFSYGTGQVYSQTKQWVEGDIYHVRDITGSQKYGYFQRYIDW